MAYGMHDYTKVTMTKKGNNLIGSRSRADGGLSGENSLSHAKEKAQRYQGLLTDASSDRVPHKGNTSILKAKDRNPSKGSYENRNDTSGSLKTRPLSKKTISSSLADRNHRNEFRTKN